VPAFDLNFAPKALRESSPVAAESFSQFVVLMKLADGFDGLRNIGDHAPDARFSFGLKNAANGNSRMGASQEFRVRGVVAVNDRQSGAHGFPGRQAETLAAAEVEQAIPKVIKRRKVRWGKRGFDPIILGVMDVPASLQIVLLFEPLNGPFFLEFFGHVQPKEEVQHRFRLFDFLGSAMTATIVAKAGARTQDFFPEVALARGIPIKETDASTGQTDQVGARAQVMDRSKKEPVLFSPLVAPDPTEEERILGHPIRQEVRPELGSFIVRHRDESFRVRRAVEIGKPFLREITEGGSQDIHGELALGYDQVGLLERCAVIPWQREAIEIDVEDQSMSAGFPRLAKVKHPLRIAKGKDDGRADSGDALGKGSLPVFIRGIEVNRAIRALGCPGGVNGPLWLGHRVAVEKADLMDFVIARVPFDASFEDQPSSFGHAAGKNRAIGNNEDFRGYAGMVETDSQSGGRR
jgi:hypothetical protein